MNSLRIAIFASGNGSNALALMKKAKALGSKVEVSFILSDKSEAGVLSKAENEGLRTYVLEKTTTKADHEEKILGLLREHHVEWIFLAGYMRVLSADFLKAFSKWQDGRSQVVNIHPSLLPAYPGVNSIERALRDQCTQTGVTLHFVDEGVDTGPIIKQQVVEIIPSESLTALAEKMHHTEHRLYTDFLSDLAQGR